MAGNDSWIYQGRQYHQWFGHGTKPGDAGPDGADKLPPLAERIHGVGHTLLAGLPASRRHHVGVRLNAHDHGRLDRLLTGVAQATVLGPRLAALRVLGRHPDAPGVAPFVKAGALLKGAETYAGLRAGSDLVARSAVDMGLDRFKPFLRDADEHLTREGGLVTLARDVTPFATPDTAAPAAAPLAKPGLPAAGEVVLRLVRALAGLAIASEVLQAYARSTDAALLRNIIQRFGLDPSKPGDAVAAVAFAWAEFRGPWVLGLPQTGPALDTEAERVMRAARADPALFARALDGEMAALSTLQAVAQGTMILGFGYETLDDEERALVAQLEAEGKSGNEIAAALEEHRANVRKPTAEERRNMAGVAVVSKPLPDIAGPWLALSIQGRAGAPVPGQVAKKLAGLKFESFRAFREAFWKAVADTPELAKAFKQANLQLMRNGRAPYPPASEQVIQRNTGQLSKRTWELHHDPALHKGGPVYDLSTIRVVTPKQYDILGNEE